MLCQIFSRSGTFLKRFTSEIISSKQIEINFCFGKTIKNAISVVEMCKNEAKDKSAFVVRMKTFSSIIQSAINSYIYFTKNGKVVSKKKQNNGRKPNTE